MKYIHIILLCLTLTSCSALQATANVAKSMLGEQPTLSVDTQIGDKASNIGQTTNNKISADKNEGIITVASDSSSNSKRFEKADTVNIQEGPNLIYMILLVLGWLLPTPLGMYRAVRSLLKGKSDTV